MDAIRRQLEEAGLHRLADAIVTACQPSVRLVAVPRGAGAAGQFGGRPNLPPEIAWPAWGEGQPLSFLAQLDLAALPHIEGLPLPRTGSLFFFYDAANQPWGFNPADAGGGRVFFSASPLGEHPPRRPHPDLDEEARFSPLAVGATPQWSLPGGNHPLFREANLTSEEFDAYWNLTDPLRGPVHRIGGHADEIQGDIRLEAQLVSNGIYCGDTTGYARGREQGLDRGASDWRLLLQIDSEDRSGMCWGDEGRLYFLVREEDLRHCRFDRIWVILQCT